MKLHIPEPCHERWNEMNPTQQGAFCQVCTKEVVNFEHMSDAEIKQYFQNATGKTCGRFRTDQLERVLQDAPVKRSPMKALWIGLGLFLAWAGKAEAQKPKLMGKVSPSHFSRTPTQVAETPKKSYELEGTITQADGTTPLAYAAISTSAGVFNADEAGKFKLTLQVPENITQEILNISAEGFLMQALPINLPANTPIKVALLPDPNWAEPMIMGEPAIEPTDKPSFWQRIKSAFTRKPSHKVGEVEPKN